MTHDASISLPEVQAGFHLTLLASPMSPDPGRSSHGEPAPAGSVRFYSAGSGTTPMRAEILQETRQCQAKINLALPEFGAYARITCHPLCSVGSEGSNSYRLSEDIRF